MAVLWSKKHNLWCLSLEIVRKRSTISVYSFFIFIKYSTLINLVIKLDYSFSQKSMLLLQSPVESDYIPIDSFSSSITWLVFVMLPFFEKKSGRKMQWKVIFGGLWGCKLQKISENRSFLWFFRKCRNSDNSCRIWSNLMYNIVLNLKIGCSSKKGFFGQILVSVILPFCDFEASVMLPFSKKS